jgi:hypothetical protein
MAQPTTSPWATVEDQAAMAANPGPPPPMAISMPTVAPTMTPAPSPNIVRMPTPQETQIANTNQELQKVRMAQERPWGFAGSAPDAANPEGLAPNHPGKLGKIAHAFSTLGNIAGDIFAPSVMENIPGTQMNRQMQEGLLAKRLNTEVGQQSEDQFRNAETAKEDEATREAPIEASDKHDQSQATTKNLQSEATDRDAAIQNPTLAAGYAHAVNQAIKEGRDPAQDPIVQHLSDAIVGLQPGQNKITEGHPVNIIGANGKPMVATFHPDTGKTTDGSGKEIVNPQPYERPQNTNVNMGTWALGEDPATGAPKMFNSKTGEMKDAPQGMAKQGTFEKGNEKVQNIIQSSAMAHQLESEAEKGNAEADPALALAYFKTIKGPDGTGIRFTQTEQNLILGARNAAGDLEALGQKVIGGGQKFTPEQRKNVVKIIDMYAQAAQRQHGGGGNPESPGSPPPGAKVIKWGDVK